MKFIYIFSFLLLTINFTFAQIDCNKRILFYTGFCTNYHANGQVSWIKEFKQGEAVGTWMYFNEKGILTKQVNTNLRKDSLANAHPLTIIEEDRGFDISVMAGDESFDKYLENENQIGGEKVFDFTDEEAEFPGGTEKMKEWLRKNLIYPPDAKKIW